MTDQRPEILKQAFSQEHPPLTEQQRQIARKACAFALIAFSNQMEGKWLNDWLKQRNIELTPEQLNFAKNLREVFPEPNEVLPKTEFDSAYIGYLRLANTPIGEAIHESLKDQNKTIQDPNNSLAPDLMKADPTGVAYLQHLLSNIEEQSTINTIALKGKEAEVRNKIVEILKKAEDIPDEPKPKKPLDDQDIGYKILDAFMSAFGGNMTQRQKFIKESRDALREETPLEFNKEGALLPSDALMVIGARLAFERWQTAVNVYMKRWGTPTVKAT